MMRRSVAWLLPLTGVLGLWGLGWHHLGRASLWYDELFNADLVLGHTLASLLNILRTEQPYPPLYPLLLKGWCALVGVQPYAPGLQPANGLEELLRFPSLAAAVLAVAVLFALGRRARLSAAAVVPLLFALHPLTVWYARDARLYSLLTLWLLLALLGLTARRRWLWIVGAAAALLTHYFALFPLVGAALAALRFGRPRAAAPGLQPTVPRRCRLRQLPYPTSHVAIAHRPLFIVHRSLFIDLLPFVVAALWWLYALPVATGFVSFATGSPPTPPVFLAELGPELLTGRDLLLPVSAAVDVEWGYLLLAGGVVGLYLAHRRDPARGGPLALGLGLGALGLFAFWQLRPVYHVRYLIWALPALLAGVVEAPAALGERWWGRRAAWAMLAPLLIAATIWCARQAITLIQADPTTWYPDHRAAVAFLNERAQPGDRGLAVAGHAAQTFSAYASPVAFAVGPRVGERVQPAGGAQLLEANRPLAGGRLWLFLYQDDAVDPGGVCVGTLEAAGGYRTEMLYSREMRLFAYALPDDAPLTPLAADHPLDISFEGGIRLRGFSLHQEGRLLAIYLFWELTEPQSAGLSATVQLTEQIGQPALTQQDQPVVNGYWPLSRLPTGEVIPQRYELVLSSAHMPGTYHLVTALYDPSSGARRPLVSGGDFLDLGEVSFPLR